MILSHPSLACSWGLVKVMAVLLLAVVAAVLVVELVEAATPPVLLLISLYLLECG